MTTEDKKAYLGDILDAEMARAHIEGGQWREIDLPGHPGAALVVWRMADDLDSSSPAQELNARKLVGAFNICESRNTLMWPTHQQEFFRAQQAAERPPMTPLQAAKEALAIAEASLRSEHGTSDSYLIASAKLEPVREAIKAAESAQP